MSGRHRKHKKEKTKYKKPMKRSINYKLNYINDNQKIDYSPPISPVSNIDEYITDIDYSNNSLFVSLESVIYGKKVNCDYCNFDVEFYWINPFIKIKRY